MKRIKKISVLLFLVIGVQHLGYGQYYSKPVNDTLEDFLNVQNAHKDGYDFANQVIDIPTNIVQKYNKLKARIIGIKQGYKIERPNINENGDTIIYQERNNVIGLLDSDAVDSRKFITGTDFLIKSISIWDTHKRIWKTIFRENKN